MKSRISPEEFVKIWQESRSVKEVMQLTGLSQIGAYKKASNYRDKGVPLKRHGWKTVVPDYEGLANLALSLENGHDDATSAAPGQSPR